MKLRALKTFSDNSISVLQGQTYKLDYSLAVPYLAADILEHAERFESNPIGRALNRIDSDYGVLASVVEKAKVIHKYGKIESTLNDTWETVQTSGGTETLLTTNAITVIVSTSASDTQTVDIEGHYLTASGDLVFHVQTATMNGTTPVTLVQPLARCSRMHSNAVYTVGRVTVRAGAGGTVYNEIAVGLVQSDKAATTISYRDFYILTAFGASVVDSNNNASCEFELQRREGNEQWRPVALVRLTGNNTTYERMLEPPVVLGPNGEFRVRARSSTAGVTLDAHFSGYLAINEALKDATPPAPA
jgi:hypothetical protein